MTNLPNETVATIPQMVERVARAAHAELQRQSRERDVSVGQYEPNNLHIDGDIDFAALMRVAIEAMRDATPAMRLAGASAILPTVRGKSTFPENSVIVTASRCHEAMIDQALIS